MKISLNTAKYYLGGAVWSDEADLVHKIGAQLGAVEDVIDYGKRYEGIIVAKVIECNKHPNADKLSVCKVDVGGHELVQVVCGAPNVREGLIVAWIPPGATVPSTYDKDPFVLESRELRGQMSNGMLASASELGINNDHSGLLEIDPEIVGEDKARPGTPFKDLYGLNDYVVDLENKMFTHRPDCFGVIGVAREFAGIYHKDFTSPDWYLKIPNIFLKSSDKDSIDVLKLHIKNDIPDLVPRFMAVAMSDVNVAPSPLWVQALLTRVGIKPINNIVDMTNHLAYITGQPLHAYDYDKVANLSGERATIVVRMAKPGDKLKLLNGKEVEPAEGTIMIATDKVPIGIGGVMGGSDTEVDENTKNIIIECANFDMYAIRRASMAHGLFTDAVTRFSKGQSLLQNDRVIVKMMEDVAQIAGGNQASDIIDIQNIPAEIYNNQSVHGKVRVSTDFINARLGLNLAKEDMMSLVRNVGFVCLEEGEPDEIDFYAPFWRTDIELKEDVVEEIGRLYGYDKLPKYLPQKTISPSIIDPILSLKSRIRSSLSAMGANELLTYSFVNKKLLENANQDPEMAYKISNAISPDLQYYRLSLTPSLLSHVHQNIKLGHDEFALFELGKTHNRKMIRDELPLENDAIALVFSCKNSKNTAFYHARKYASELIPNAKFYPYIEAKIENAPFFSEMAKPYDISRSAVVMVGDVMLGVVGEFKQDVVTKFKLPDATAGFELCLQDIANIYSASYTPLSRYPATSQDICLEVDKSMNYSDLDQKLDDVLAMFGDDVYVDKNLIDIYADQSIGDKKRITYRLKFVSYDRTLTEDVVSSHMSEVEAKLADIAKRI